MNKKNKNGRLIVIMGVIAIIIVNIQLKKNTLLPLLTSIMSMITLTM